MSSRGSIRTSPVKRPSHTIGTQGLSINHLRRIIQDKIIGKINGADEIRGAFSIFGRNKDGISPSQFRHAIAKQGIVLSVDDAERVFRSYDEDGNGRMDIYELMRNLLPKDYDGSTWIVRADRARRGKAEARKNALKQYQDRQFQGVRYPKNLRKCVKPITVEEMEKILQDKIVAGTKKATDVLRHAYYMFGRPQDGITMEHFKHQVRQLGIPATNDDCRALFRRYDSDGNGRLDFYEFINNLLPKDYPEKPWYQKRGEQDARRFLHNRASRNDESKGKMFEQTEYPTCLKNFKMNTIKIEKALYEKLIGHARVGQDEYRKIYDIFGRPSNGITVSHFKKVLHRLGIPATQGDIQALFDERYDKSGNGIVQFPVALEIIRQNGSRSAHDKPWFQKLGERTNKKILSKSHRSKPPVEPNFFRNSFKIDSRAGTRRQGRNRQRGGMSRSSSHGSIY
jgi:Ca2+-binding EF-hand superfamily protein